MAVLLSFCTTLVANLWDSFSCNRLIQRGTVFHTMIMANELSLKPMQVEKLFSSTTLGQHLTIWILLKHVSGNTD